MERERIIGMARATGEPDWLAVPVAFYAGMRREEIYRMRWVDVDLAARTIAVPVTKTKRPRKLPLASGLWEFLEAVPEGKRAGFVAAAPGSGRSRTDRVQTLVKMNRRLAKREKDTIPEERIGWNAWRHTFGSLLAQDGVSLDKISAWMGNTPEVCRRHYAQFVPRDRHDEDIDRL